MLTTRIWRAFLRKLFVAPKRRYKTRLRFEQLEDRVVPAMVKWNNANGGNWDVAQNWLGDVVPGSGDTAVINLTGVTVTVQSGDSISVQSIGLGGSSTLSFTGGTLEVTSGASTLNGTLSMTGGTLEAAGTGATLTASGTTSVASANLYAESGAILSLLNLTSYVSDGTTFEATGAGSELDVPTLRAVTQPSGASWIVNALSGGTIDFSGLSSLSGTGAIRITDTGDSSILNPNLTTLSGVSVTLDGTDTKVADSWTSLTSGSLTVEDGGSYMLPGLTDVDQSNLEAESGGSLTLPNLTSYVSDGTTFESTGAGSELDLSALNAATQPSGASWIVNALSGGAIDFSGLSSLSGTGAIRITDTGDSSVLNPNLTTLSGVSVTLDGTDTKVANSWTSLTSSSLTVEDGGSYTLPGLTDVNQSNLEAESGGTLTLPNVTSYLSASTIFEATGTGSELDLSALNAVTQLSGNPLVVNALSGGTIDLSGLTSLNGNGKIYIADTGNSSILDPNLTALTGVSVNLDGTDTKIANSWTSFNSGSLTVEDSGSYTLPGLTDVDQSSLEAESSGSLTLPNVTSYISDSDLFEATGTGSQLDLSALNVVTQVSQESWIVDALSGGTIDLSGLTSLNGNGKIYIADTGNSSILDPNLTALTGVSVTLDGTDTKVANSWTSLTSGSLTVEDGGSCTFPNLLNADITGSKGTILSFPVLAQGTVTLGNGMSVSIQGTLVSLPNSGTTGASIDIPQSEGLNIVLQNSGTLTNTAFNIGKGSNVVLYSGTYLGTTTFDMSQGATASLASSQTTTIGGTLTGAGAGTVQFSDGILEPALGGLTLNFPGAMFEWSGIFINLQVGDLTNMGTINLAGSNSKEVYNDGTFTNYGTIIQTGSGNLLLHSDSVSPTTLVNESGATYILESNSGISEAGLSAVDNAGVIQKTTGTGVSQLSIDGVLNNTGTIEADSGTLYLDANSISQVSSGSLAAGTWNAMNGATLEFPTGTNITNNAGNITLSGKGATIDGITNLSANSGSFTLTNGADFTTTGTFSNSGSLTLGPGSTLTVARSFTQTSTGTLTDQIGGSSASNLYGKAAIGGAANLAGTLSIEETNNYVWSLGQDYQVLSFADSSGNFTAVEGLPSTMNTIFTPTSLTLGTTAYPPNLVPVNVTAPSTSTTGQSIAVNWKVEDQSSNAANGNWQDSVYLSTTPTITSSSILLGAVQHSGGLAANASYNASLSATLPAVAAGNYHVLMQVDSLFQTGDENYADTILAATTGQLSISLPALTLGTPTSGSFTAADEDQYYQVTVPAGGSLQISLSSAASSGATALYVSQGTLPTSYNYLYAANVANQPNQTLIVPQVASSTTYYILAQSVSGAAATADFTLTATQTNAITVTGISSYSGGNAGNVTIEINGTNLTPSTTASLTLGTTTINAAAIDYVSASRIYVTFNLTGASAGSYILSVQQGTQSTTEPNPFKVMAAHTGSLSVNLSVPQYIRSGRTGTIVVTYTNQSNNDIVAPLLAIESTNTSVYFSTTDDPNDYTQDAQVLAVAPNGPAGILSPGQSGQLTLTILSDDTIDNDTIPVQVSQIEMGQTIDWASQKSSLQPSTIPTAAWNVIWTNLMATVGTTTDSYKAALTQAATYLSGLGESATQVSDVNNLWSFLVSQADAEFPSSTLTSAVDASLPTPGSLSLAMDRTFMSNIAGRYTEGIFGLGWTTSWQTSLSVDGSGDVTIDTGGALGFFVKQANGTYLDINAEYGTLTQSGGIFTFTSTSGIQDVFQANGLLSYEQDTNGNRIALGYNDLNQIVSLSYSNAADPLEPSEELTLAYNSQGFVSQVADGTGDVWTYAYDSAGHLLVVTAPGNLTTGYTYGTGSNPETANALLSIANPDGSQQDFTYDSQGRLSNTSANGGSESVTYSYLSEGEVTATDAAGDKTTVWYNELGVASRIESPLGGITTYQYDNNGNLISYTDAGGDTYQYSYDQNGNLTKTVNPLGQTVQMTHNSLSDLTSITDADNNMTQYSYNSAGNLLGITYPDGTSQTFTYDPLGNMTETIEQNGDPVNYQYNSDGLVTEESFADGTGETFTYDAHGNVLTAETFDSSGNLTGTTTLTYNAANELTSINYPGGLSLAFTYNSAGQRTQSVDQSGFTVNYSYNSLGQLSELTDGSGDLIVQYTYNNLGQIVEKQNGNGTYTTYAYDADGNLTNEVNCVNSTGTTINSSFTYTYNVLDEMTSMTDASGNTTSYSYDATGQLTGITLPGGGTITYVYNAAGDRTEVIDNGQTTTYTSNSDNEITTVGSATYTYDPNGNLASATDSSGTTTYTYNDLNQLVSITNPDGSVESFQYSPLGFMVGTSITSNGTTSQTNYLVDPSGLGNVVASYTGTGSLIANYVYGLGLVSTTGPSGTGYYDFDASGNTVGITGSKGNYVNHYSYLPFGETTTISAALPNPFTFAGQVGVMQLGSNLFYMRARDYTPTTGQFTSNDPTGLAGGDSNLRRYVNNDPVGYVDPLGMSSMPAGTITWSALPGGGEQEIIWNGDGNPGIVNDYNSDGQKTSSTIDGKTTVYPPPLPPSPPLSPPPLTPPPTSTPPEFHFHFDPHFEPHVHVELFPIKPIVIVIPLPIFIPIPIPIPPPKSVKGVDPNALIGPAGYGSQGFIQDSGTLPYTIDFENDGTAAAQDVAVTEQLDPNLDWSTFQLGSFGFGPINVTVPAGLTQYQTTISYENTDGTPLDVLINLDFNVQTGLLTATFTSIDPSTGQAPTGVFDGFLYPNNSSGVGDGYIQYAIQPKSGVATGTTINQQASVVFDTNAAIDTEVVSNTIDSTPPTSSVTALLSTETSKFVVNWSGSDPNSPGIASYAIYVSVNGSSYTPWLTNTTQTSAVYSGTVGDTYSFYSVATDNVGLVQPTPSTAQASTAIVKLPATSLSKSTLKPSSSTNESGDSITISLQAVEANGQKETSGGFTVAFKLSSTSGGQGTFSTVTDNGNGTYTVTFTGTIAGHNTIRAFINGLVVTSAAPAITVTPAPLSLEKSVVRLSSATIKAGSKVTVVVQPEDAAGNKINEKGLVVDLSLGNSSGAEGTFSKATYNANGTYTAAFAGTLVGTNTIVATIGGSTLTSPEPTVTVAPGPVSAAKSVVKLSAGSLVAGNSITITLQAVDAYGNQETTGGMKVEFALGKSTGARGVFSAVKDNHNGTYTATFTGRVAGSNNIVVTINGVRVTSAAPAVTVTPGAVSLAKSAVTLSAASVKPGGSITVTLHAKDAYGNSETVGGLIVAFALASNKGGQGTFSAVTDNGNGTYTATFTATVTGINTIEAEVSGKKVTSTPASITIL
jgi:RHS repeat-associated protein